MICDAFSPHTQKPAATAQYVVTCNFCLVAKLWLAGQAVTTQSDDAERLADIIERLGETQARVAELSIQLNRASQTSQTAQKLGAVRLVVPCQQPCQMCMRATILACLMKHCLAFCDAAVLCMQVWVQRAHKLLQLPCLLPMTENDPAVARACTAALDRFRIAPYSIPAQTGKVFASE